MWEVAEIWEAAHSLKSKPFKAELTGCLRASPPLSDTPGRKDLVCHAFTPSPRVLECPQVHDCAKAAWVRRASTTCAESNRKLANIAK